MGQAEIKVNKPGNQIYHSTKMLGRREVGVSMKTGSIPEEPLPLPKPSLPSLAPSPALARPPKTVSLAKPLPVQPCSPQELAHPSGPPPRRPGPQLACW